MIKEAVILILSMFNRTANLVIKVTALLNKLCRSIL